MTEERFWATPGCVVTRGKQAYLVVNNSPPRHIIYQSYYSLVNLEDYSYTPLEIGITSLSEILQKAGVKIVAKNLQEYYNMINGIESTDEENKC